VQAAYHPEILTRLLLYSYAIGESSSRRIEQATYDNVAFRYLSADQHPDHETIANSDSSIWRAWADCLCRPCGCVKEQDW
jgi:transposase